MTRKYYPDAPLELDERGFVTDLNAKIYHKEDFYKGMGAIVNHKNWHLLSAGRAVMVADRATSGACNHGEINIGNCMLCAQLGLEPEFDQSAAYVEGWLKALKEDSRAIFRAASEAQKAVDYIMARAAQVDRMAAE